MQELWGRWFAVPAAGVTGGLLAVPAARVRDRRLTVPAAGVTDRCEPPGLDAANQT